MPILPKEKLDALSNDPRANYWAVCTAFVTTTVLSLAALLFWLSVGPTALVEASVPGLDGRPDKIGPDTGPADLAGIFARMDGEPSELPGEWAQFRGPNSDNIVTDAPPLNTDFGEEGPKVAWSTPLGDGYAAPVVYDGSVYILDYDDEAKADALRCLNLESGEEIWRRSYEIAIKRNHGMSRTIPVVNENYVVTMGPRCHVVTLDRATGDFRWGIDLQHAYGTVEPLWYTGQCPIIDNGEVIVAPCGEEVFMMGIDIETGEVNWTTPNEKEWNMSHSSVIPLTILGKKMFVYCALGGIAGISAEEADRGEMIWSQTWDAKVVAPSPVKAGEDRIFMTAGYASGAMMLKFAKNGDGLDVEVDFKYKPKDGLCCEQQTPIFHDGRLYGILPKDAGGLKGQFACFDTANNLIWSSGADHRFGLGPFLLADDKFFILDDEGMLTVLDATKEEYTPLAQAEVLEGHDAWGPITLAGSRMFVRDLNTMVCLDLSVN